MQEKSFAKREKAAILKGRSEQASGLRCPVLEKCDKGTVLLSHDFEGTGTKVVTKVPI